ncbi:MAG TPA: metallophosphoesterase [Gemmataceae bacterium]|jgi:putative SbcD/Mre11-related phosphoesterase|nr:metallophosphoesterase [Gemmataceae bacterium]
MTLITVDSLSRQERAVAQIGEEWQLTPERVALHLPSSTAIMADLHLGYDLTRCQSGEAVPIVSVEEQWRPLDTLISCHDVKKLIAAGDLVERSHGNLIASLFKDWLLERNVELIAIVPGNHDGGIDLDGLVPLFESGIQVGNWQVVHGDKRLPSGKIVLGHHHPCAKWGRLSAPCFLFGDNRLVLPAFSQDAAGGNVRSSRRWKGYRCYVIAGSKVMDFGEL